MARPGGPAAERGRAGVAAIAHRRRLATVNRLILGLLLAGAFGVLGCGGSPSSEDPRKVGPGKTDSGKTDSGKTDSGGADSTVKPSTRNPPTPRDALVQATEGLFQPDEEKLFKAVRADDAQKGVLKARIELLKAGRAFRDAFVADYGKEAWKKFQDPPPERPNGEFPIPIIDEADEAAFARKKAEVKEDGDKASGEIANAKGERKPCRLDKVDDGWLVDAESLTAPPGQLEQTLKDLTFFRDLIRQYRKAIGASYEGRKITPEDIAVEMGRTQRLRVFPMAKPPGERFDVNKLKD
jgi:hypothetical protein